MLDRLNALSQNCNVSGCEVQMRRYLSEQLRKSGLISLSDETGCICVKKPGSSQSKLTLLISVPMDVPGFLTLFIQQNTGYLVPTGELPVMKTKTVALLDEDGHRRRGIPLPDREKEWKITKKNIQLGDTFRLVPALSQNEHEIIGYFATTFARIQMLLDLSNESLKNDIIFLFTTSSCTRAAKEKNICRRLQPDGAILLGAVKSASQKPLLLIKDGSAFSDEALTDAFLKKQSIASSPEMAVFSNGITKAGELHASEGIPTLSLALPYSQNEGKECFSFKTYESLFQSLKNFL